jgi:RNA polymerase sigma factor (sigma-70 family)
VAVDERIREVYEVSYQRLVVQMLALCGNQADAEEAVQEAFVQALRRRREFAEVRNPEGWLRTVALNRLRNGWRHAAVVRRFLTAVPGPAAPLELGPDHVALVEALSSLTEDERVVVVLHHLADRRIDEIAEEVGVPVGTVKSRLSRGRAHLAGLMAEPAESEQPEEVERHA